MNPDSPSLAVIDGALVLLNRLGARSIGHLPLATAVVEFRQAGLSYFVREHPYGLLPGLPNLYCLDGAFRLQWMAEWPHAEGPCLAIVEVTDETVVTRAASGSLVHVSTATGKLQAVEQLLSATG